MRDVTGRAAANNLRYRNFVTWAGWTAPLLPGMRIKVLAGYSGTLAAGEVRLLRMNRPVRCWLALAVGVFLLSGLAACSSSGPGTGATGTSCGDTRTGANVPVTIKVVKGSVNCGSVLQVEDRYAAMMKAGDVPGNGGGAPVTVDGWTCQGYPTPEVLRTGAASQCHTGSAEVVAELPVPSTGS